MTIPAIKNFQNYNKYKTESGYTKQGELQQYMQNQNDCLTALTDTMLWQPETTYEVNKIIVSPSMPTGVRARVTAAGKTGDTEPTWTTSGTTVSNGTATFTMETMDYTQLITTAVNSLKDLIEDTRKKTLLAAHPVGSYYFSDDPTNPSTLFGGTWKAVDPGRALVAQGTVTAEDGEILEFKAGNTYGEFKHQLTVGELASHGHLVRTWNTVSNGGTPQLYRNGRWENYTGGAFRVSGTWNDDVVTTKNAPQSGYGDPAGTTDGTGNNAYHNNVPASIACFCWKRTA